MNALARVLALVGRDSFEEHDPAPGDAVRVGSGSVAGRPLLVVAHDEPGLGGSARRMIDKILFAHEEAVRRRCPIAYLFDSSSRPLDTRGLFAARDGVGRLFASQARLLGEVPQVTGVFGPLMSARSFPVALSDAVALIAERSFVGLSHPRMVRALTGEDATMDALGGVALHARRSGLADTAVRDEAACLTWIRRYLGYMPQHRDEPLPLAAPGEPRRSGKRLEELVPAGENTPFSMRALLDEIFDADSRLEMKRHYAPEIVTALARLDGRPVGVVANEPRSRGGILFVESCRKAMRFARLCDAYGLPLVFFLDVPGLMVGTRSEELGIVSAAAGLFTVLARSTVPRVAVVVRKAYSAGLYAMSGPAFDPDAFLALPTARIGVFGEKAARHVASLNGSAAPAEPTLEELAQLGVVDAIVPLEELRAAIVARLSAVVPRERGRGQGLLPL